MDADWTSRSCGILLHPTSLPGPYGIGDLGPPARAFVDTLAAASQSYWQVLPLGPTGYGDSPYQTFSAFAGSELLISPDMLAEQGLLSPTALSARPRFSARRVEYGRVARFKKALLQTAFLEFESSASPSQRDDLERFVRANETWLPDYALFMALKDAHGGDAWTGWPRDIATRRDEALSRWRAALDHDVRKYIFCQHVFFTQWAALRAYAARKGVRMIGDAPIFVAHDSADCWAHPELFELASDGAPLLVAGVPPDYFSADGQLWGNPHYRWEVHRSTGFRWWLDRLKMAFAQVDLLRLDHFRGFAGYWAIPAGSPNARSGEWLPGPGAALFEAARRELGALPIIAEDLGVITPDVEELRDRFGFPGMRVLQFAFGGGADNRDLPHNYDRRCVVYTGTHDNDTSKGWLAAAPPEVRAHALSYTASDGRDPVWDLIRLAYASVAVLAVIPWQDVLGLGSLARMNRPGQQGGNWQWRTGEDAARPEIIARLLNLSRLYGRVAQPGLEK